VALECFLVTSLFCNEEHRSLSMLSKATRNYLRGVVFDNTLTLIWRVGILNSMGKKSSTL
jgi:hypothetical protein